jgi:ribA/ribD-fused uncharacterized protein
VKQLLCTNCWATDHSRKNCKNDSKCKVCRGHSPGDPKCASNEIQNNIIAFNGGHILSNFYPCDITIFWVFHKSEEHAFQHTKALRCGDQTAAVQIQNAVDALSAQRMGDKVKTNEQWVNTSEKVMTGVIENKCVQVERFREKLRSVNKNTVSAESTYNDTWGTGLDNKQSAWPGKKLLGTILTRVSKKMRKRKKNDQWCKASQPKQQPKINT